MPFVVKYNISWLYRWLNAFSLQGIPGPAGKPGRQGRDGTAVSFSCYVIYCWQLFTNVKVIGGGYLREYEALCHYITVVSVFFDLCILYIGYKPWIDNLIKPFEKTREFLIENLWKSQNMLEKLHNCDISIL